MPFKIEATPAFLSEAKKLSKKYQSLKKDIATLAGSLADKPQQGTSLGKNIYKVRMAISSKGKGKMRWSKGDYLGESNCRNSLSCFYL